METRLQDVLPDARETERLYFRGDPPPRRSYERATLRTRDEREVTELEREDEDLCADAEDLITFMIAASTDPFLLGATVALLETGFSTSVHTVLRDAVCQKAPFDDGSVRTMGARLPNSTSTLDGVIVFRRREFTTFVMYEVLFLAVQPTFEGDHGIGRMIVECLKIQLKSEKLAPAVYRVMCVMLISTTCDAQHFWRQVGMYSPRDVPPQLRDDTSEFERSELERAIVDEMVGVYDYVPYMMMFPTDEIASLVTLLKSGAASRAAIDAAGALRDLAISKTAIARTEKHRAIRTAGGIERLVALLMGGTASDAATSAAGALMVLTYCNAPNCQEVRSSGGIAPLVALLSGDAAEHASSIINASGTLANICCWIAATKNVADEMREAGGIPLLVGLLNRVWMPSEAVMNALKALSKLAETGMVNKNAICESGGVAPLVALLQGGAESEAAASAAEALMKLTDGNVALCDTVHKAGAVAPLVALLTDGEMTRMKSDAASTLYCIASIHATPVLDAIVAATPPPSLSRFRVLQSRLRDKALSRLEASCAGDDEYAVRAALEAAAMVGVAEAALARGRARLEELETEAAWQARRCSFGLGHIEKMPNEFICPISLCPMVDPVVASDGKSYERSELVRHLTRHGTKALSPLTREPIQQLFFTNEALRKRIECQVADFPHDTA